MITVTKKVFFTTGTSGRKQIVDRPPATPTVDVGRVPRVSKLMALALQFEDLLRTGKIGGMAEIARLAMVTQPRVTQVLNLCLLAPDIQEELLFLPRVLKGRDPIHEKRMRRICRERSFARQRRMWESLKQVHEIEMAV